MNGPEHYAASDPAVAAAFRVAEDWGGPYDIGAGIEAAREALARVQELHYKVTIDANLRSAHAVCAEGCLDMHGNTQEWPCDTAKLVYPEEEL